MCGDELLGKPVRGPHESGSAGRFSQQHLELVVIVSGPDAFAQEIEFFFRTQSQILLKGEPKSLEATLSEQDMALLEMDLDNGADGGLIIRIMDHGLISILKNIFPLMGAGMDLDQAHQDLRVEMLVATAIGTQPVFWLIFWKETLVTVVGDLAIIVGGAPIIGAQIASASSFQRDFQVTGIHPPAFIDLKPVEVIGFAMDEAGFLPGGQGGFEHVAQVMHGDMKIAEGFIGGEFWPEEVNKLIGGTEFTGIKQEPFENHASLIAALHQFSNGLFAVKKAKGSKEIGPIVCLILILARMDKSAGRGLLHRFHGNLLAAKSGWMVLLDSPESKFSVLDNALVALVVSVAKGGRDYHLIFPLLVGGILLPDMRSDCLTFVLISCRFVCR